MTGRGIFTITRSIAIRSTATCWTRGKLHTGDGKLVIYVQNDEPKDANQRKNWLPAPKEGFQFAARFYGPGTALIDGSYNMPGLVRLEIELHGLQVLFAMTL